MILEEDRAAEISDLDNEDQSSASGCNTFRTEDNLTHREGNELAVSPMRKLKQLSRAGSLISDISREDIRLVYTFTRRLGSGSYGTVRIAYKTVNPGKNFAVKSIRREILIGNEEEEDL